jgi:hypothetical protein
MQRGLTPVMRRPQEEVTLQNTRSTKNARVPKSLECSILYDGKNIATCAPFPGLAVCCKGCEGWGGGGGGWGGGGGGEEAILQQAGL